MVADGLGKVQSVKAGWYQITASYPVYTSSIGKVATAGLKAAAQKRVGAFKHEFNQLDAKPEHEYTVDWSVEPKLRRENLLSFLVQCHFYTGGAHPNHDSETFNYQRVDGKVKRIHLADIMRVRMVPEAFASGIVIPKLKEKGATEVQSGAVTHLTREQADKFYITDEGLTWRFDPYEMGSYAEGAIEVTATWDELKGKVIVGP